MKVKLLRACQGSNPAYDRALPESEDNPRYLTHEPGTEIEDPEAYVLCTPNAAGVVLAEPVDAEATARVAAAQQRREAALLRMTPAAHAARQATAAKLATLQDDGSNGPSEQTEQEQTSRRRKSGK